jgi:L-ascorbate metabolism protein UlaG (beta-lactamase superfamily)
MRRCFILIFIFLAVFAGARAQRGFERDSIRTASGDLIITFIGHSSLLFTYQGKNIYVDPVLQVADFSSLPKADAILITHDHGDHLDAAAIDKISNPETEIFLTRLCFSKLKKGKVVSAPDYFIAAGVPVEATEAYNVINRRGNGIPFHPKGDGNGYVFIFGQTRLYVAGDTELTKDMLKLKDIDILFLPIGLPYTMSPLMAIEAAKKLRPKIFYPYHFNNSNPEEIVRAFIGTPVEVRVRLMK